ncbi:MAG: hypothetical protein EXR99_10105 [Gemmataceae bacterium]|nr:hypothetical protein [Gemmataceae bacterium]
MKKTLAACCFSGLMVFAFGCGGGGTKYNPISMKLTQGGSAYSVPAGEKISVEVVGAGGGKGAGNGELQSDGKYLVGKGNGIPPGKYDVFITKYSDKADTKKGPPTRTKLKDSIDVTGADKQEFTVDIGK